MSSSFAKTASWRIASVASSVVANLLVLKLCDHHLAGGTLALVYAAITLLAYLPLLDGGFRMTLNRELLQEADPEERRRWVGFGQTLNVVVGLGAVVFGAVALSLYSLSPGVRGGALNPGFFVGLGVAGGIAFFANTQAGTLIGLGRQWLLFAFNTLAAWLNVILLALGFGLGLGAWAFLIALAGTAAIQIPVVWLAIRHISSGAPVIGSRLGTDFRKRLRRLWSGSMAALRNQIFTALLYSVDILLVTWLLNHQERDGYAVAARVFAIVRVTLQAADEAVWPRVAADRVRGGQLALVMTRVNAWLYGAAMVAAGLTLGPFLESLVTAERRPTQAVILWMVGRGIITGLCSQPAYFLYGDGQFSRLGRFMGFELLALLVLSVPLAQKFGGAGLAAATCIATLAGTIFWLPKAYAESARVSFLPWWAGLWTRAVVAGMTTYGFVLLASPMAYGWMGWGIVGMLAAGLAVVVGMGSRWFICRPATMEEIFKGV